MKVREALEQGYVECFRSLQRGYVSVKRNPMDGVLFVAKGRRKGMLYYLAHNPNSTQYCFRVYLCRK